jgi:hypothetical protein
MKLKSKFDKATKSYLIDIFGAKDQNALRYDIVKELSQNSDICFYIHTQLAMKESGAPVEFAKKIDSYLQEQGIKALITPDEVKPPSIFGIPISTKKITEYKIVFLINQDQFSKDFFDSFLSRYDFYAGFDLKSDIDKLFEEIRKGYVSNFFESDYFEDVMYASILTERVRTTREYKINS